MSATVTTFPGGLGATAADWRAIRAELADAALQERINASVGAAAPAALWVEIDVTGDDATAVLAAAALA